MIINSKALVLVSILLLAVSCVSQKRLTYLQFTEGSPETINNLEDVQVTSTQAAYRIMPYDNLYIRVVTPDPQWSMLFNTDMGSVGITQESAALSGYIVGTDGFIEIPYVGKVMVAGNTLLDVKTKLDSIFKNYVTDASIMLRLVNNYVSILGEVNSPGRYILTKDRINIFEALAMAGDMSSYSNRQKVRLIRPSPYGPLVKEFSLTDRSILSSEYYYIMPNDIIYAIPRKGRSFQLNSSVWTLFMTSISSTLGILAFFRTL